MIITKNTAYTKGEIRKLAQQFDVYIKTVIDIKQKICSAGCDRHFESEAILLQSGSKQEDIWGGGIDLETKTIDFNSFINIRPTANNTSNEIQNEDLRKDYEALTKYFFRALNNKLVLESLAMDLKRVALGYYRGSLGMAKRFSEEAHKRKQEIKQETIPPYLKTLLNKLDLGLDNADKQKAAEDALMTSVLLQNYITKYLS